MPAGERRAGRIGLAPPVLGKRLAGEHAPVEQQAVGADDAKVGRYHVAALEEHDISRHERRGRDDGDGPVAADPRDRRRGLAQRLERPLAAVLGDDAGTDDRQQPGEYEQSVAHLADDHREHTSHREHEHERLRDRLDQHPPERVALRVLERVGSGLLGTLHRLDRRQAPCRVDAEFGGDGCLRLCVVFERRQ